MVTANLLIVWALLARDFCVGYVAQLSSRQVWPAKNRDPVMQCQLGQELLRRVFQAFELHTILIVQAPHVERIH